MYKGIIYALTVIYQHMTNAGPDLSREQVQAISAGAKALSDTAPMGVIRMTDEGPVDREQLQRAQLVEQHIEAMQQYLLHQEVI